MKHPDPATVQFTGSRSTTGGPNQVSIVINGHEKPLPLHLEVVNHSPTGFEWGYAGSGPAQLALAMATELVGPERAEVVHQDLKFELIARISLNVWMYTGLEIIRRIEAIEARHGYQHSTADEAN